jgi:hypothetical protein
VKTLFVAYRVTDLERSLAFYTTLGYVDLGRVTFDDGGSLAVLKFPHEPVATLELVHRPDHYLAFGRMMLDGGKHGGERILSRASVELMTTDHLTPELRAASDSVPVFLGGAAGGSACPPYPAVTA